MNVPRIILAILAVASSPALAGILCPEKVSGHNLTIRHDVAGHRIRVDVDYDMSCPQKNPNQSDGCVFYKVLNVFVQDSQHPRVEWGSAWMGARLILGCQDGKPTQPPDKVGPDKKLDPTPGTLCHDPHYGGGYVRILSSIQLGGIRGDGTAPYSQRSKKITNLCGL